MRVPLAKLGVGWTVSTVTRGRTRLRYGVYRHSPTPVRQFLVLVNGRSEFIEKHAHLVDHLNLEPGCALLTWDHRGQGQSDGRTAHCRDYRDFVDDALAIMTAANPLGLPYAILAHSMGSLISLYGCALGRFAPEALILSSPLLGIANLPFPRPIVTTIVGVAAYVGAGGWYVPGQGRLAPYKQNAMTHSRFRYAQRLASLYPHRGATFGWVHATLVALRKVHHPSFVRSLSMPITVLTGGAEAIVDPQAIASWVAQVQAHAACPHCEHTLIPGARHELLGESTRFARQAFRVINTALDSFFGRSLS